MKLSFLATFVFASMISCSLVNLTFSKEQVDLRTPMAIAFDQCSKEILDAEAHQKFDECRRAPRSRWNKATSRKSCMAMVPRAKVSELMDCVTDRSAR